MRRFIPLNRVLRNGMYRALRFAAGFGAVVLISSATNTGPSMGEVPYGDDMVVAKQTSLTNSSDHFRSNGQGTWQTVAIWQSSPDSVNWMNATAAPTHLSSSIVIRNSNTVQINQTLSVDQLHILDAGVLRLESGELTLLNGPGDDISISNGGVLQFSGGTWPNYENMLVRIRVQNDGIIRVNVPVDAISEHLAGNSSSGKIIYDTGAIFEWNNGSAFSTSGQTYFPDATAAERPVFRITQGNVFAGASMPTTFNGVLEVNGTTTLQGVGTKFFRNGIRGSAVLTQSTSSGKFVFSGDTAVLGGIGVITLNGATGNNVIETGVNTYLYIENNKVINSTGTGRLVIKGTSKLDTRGHSFSGTGGLMLESDATYITAHPTGFGGALGALSGGILISAPQRQTYVFNRIGLQDSGTSGTVKGQFIITNGSKLNLSSSLSIDNVADGYLKIEGTGSELRANTSRTIEIVGDRSIILENGGIMHASCLNFVNISTDFSDGIALLNGDGQPIRCNSLSSTKISGGGLTIAPNTDVEIRTSLTVNYFATAVFTDSGNTISVGDDLQMSGTNGAAQYNLTGTIIMTGAGAGSSTSSIRSQSSEIHAELNNLIINSASSTSYPQFEPSSGNANIIIKGDFIIQNASVNRPVRLFGNTYEIGGNYSNINQNRLSEGTSTFVFNGTENQTITCTGGEVFSNLEIDKAAGDIELESNLTINGQATFNSGLVHTSEHRLALGPAASATGASQSSYVNGKVRKTGFTAEVPFVFPVGDFTEGADGWNVFQPAELETAVTTTTAAFDVQYHHENFNVIFPQPFNPPTAGFGTVSTCNYWDIDRISGTVPVKVGLSWNEAHCFDVTEPASLLVARYDGDANDWSEANFPGGATHTFSPSPQYATGWVYTMHPVNNFSPFAIGSIGADLNVLPIELIGFEAKIAGSNLVGTYWATLSETNNDFFTVERSTDARTWAQIGQVQGAGTSHMENHYVLYDTNPLNGRVYYRLRQTDFDGSYTFSEISTVMFSAPGQEGELGVRRIHDGIEITWKNVEDAASIEVLDFSGRSVFNQEYADFVEEKTRVYPKIASGVYLLRLQENGRSAAVKFFY